MAFNFEKWFWPTAIFISIFINILIGGAFLYNSINKITDEIVIKKAAEQCVDMVKIPDCSCDEVEPIKIPTPYPVEVPGDCPEVVETECPASGECVDNSVEINSLKNLIEEQSKRIWNLEYTVSQCNTN